MLDPDGHLWLTNWDLAGWYPKSFEYSGMHFGGLKCWGRFAYFRWILFSWIAAGPFLRARDALRLLV